MTVPVPGRPALGAVVAADAVIGAGVDIGAHVVIHPRTEVGDGVVLESRVVLGKPVVRAGSGIDPAAAARVGVGARATLGAGTVVCAGARIGADAVVGEAANIREGADIGAGVTIGHGAAIGAHVRIGEGATVGPGSWITSWTTLEEDVVIGARVITMNDDSMARLPVDGPLRGPTVRRGARIGAAARLTPGVVVGADAVVEAGSLVRRDVAPGLRVGGVPARELTWDPRGETHTRPAADYAAPRRDDDGPEHSPRSLR